MVGNIDLARLGFHRSRTTPASSTPTSKLPADAPAVFETVLKQQTAASAEVARPSLHTIASLPNGGLMLNPTGNNALTGGTIPYNPNFYATADAASQLAAQVGGSVVDLRGQFSNNQAEYYISLPNGITINAGNLVAILNNAVYQENSRVMDGKIAELLNNDAVGTPGAGVGKYTVVDGRVTYDPAGQRANT